MCLLNCLLKFFTYDHRSALLSALVRGIFFAVVHVYCRDLLRATESWVLYHISPLPRLREHHGRGHKQNVELKGEVECRECFHPGMVWLLHSWTLGAVIISKRPVYDWPTDILPQTGVGHEAPFLPENINASSAVAIGKEPLKEEGQHSSRLYFDQACQSPTQSLCWKPMLREWSFWWWNTTEALGNWVAEKKDQRVKWLMCRHKSRAQQPVCEPVLGNRKWGKAIPYDFLASQSRFSEEILSQTIRLRATGGNPLKLIPTFMCVCMPDTCMHVGTHTHARGHV